MRDAKHKEDQAMASYSPLAVKVFGKKTDQDMFENGTDAILGTEPSVLHFAHLGSSALAFATGCTCAS